MNTTIDKKTLLYILEHTPSNQNILISGKHGIGKSEIITDYYTNLGYKVVPLFLGQMSDAGDIIGLPNKNETTGQTEFMLPYWFPVDNTPIVLFLDELNRARPELLQVVMDLVLNKKIAGKKLSEGSIIISAINDGDEYTLTDMDPALVSRFNVYNFVPTVKEWVMWGQSVGISEYVLDFISSNEKFLDFSYDESDDTNKKGYDRRSWVRVSNIIKQFNSSDIRLFNNDCFKKLVSGVVGDKAGLVFCSYICNSHLMKAEDILLASDFDSVVPTLNSYNIVEHTRIVDKVCMYIHNNNVRKDASIKDICLDNFSKYINYMITKHKESMGYFVSNYSSMSYPNMNMFIASNPGLEEQINEFISEIEL